MDSTTVILIVRYVLTAAGGVLVAHGYLNSGEWEQASGALLTLVPIILGVISHKQAQTAVVTAAATGVAAQATPLSAIKASPENIAATAPATTKGN